MLGHSQTKGRAKGNPNLGLNHRATSRLYQISSIRMTECHTATSVKSPPHPYPGYGVVDASTKWASDGFAGLAPPCSFPAGRSRFGVCDLEGNLAEWAMGANGIGMALGGNWLDGQASSLRLGMRAFIPEVPKMLESANGSYLVGFRCVH